MKVFDPDRTDVGPTAPLDQFPSYALRQGTVLYRCHALGADPFAFARTPGFRLNLRHGGTAYLSRDIDTAIHQVLGRAAGGMYVATNDQVERLALSELTVTRPYKLASFIARDAKRFGATRKLVGVNEGPVWADALSEAGFDGALYEAEYSVDNHGNSIAIFGDKDLGSLPRVAVSSVSVRDAVLQAGYRILPRPTRALLTIK